MIDKETCETVLTRLEVLDDGKYFARPIKEVLEKEPRVYKRYMREIKNPMDFSTVRRKLKTGKYQNRTGFLADVRLIFENARAFNESGSVVYDKATELLEELDVVLASELEDAMDTSYAEMADADFDEGKTPHSSEAQAVEAQEEEVLNFRHGNSAFYLPLPRSLKRVAYISEPGPPASYYQWEPDQTDDIIKVAEAAEIPVEQIALPCFAHVQSNQTSSTAFRARRRRPDVTDDFDLYEPKAKRDLALMQGIYRKLVTDGCEKIYQKHVASLPNSIAYDDDDWRPPADCKDILSFHLPPAEFYLCFEEFATDAEKQRLKRTSDAGDARMTLMISTYADIRRVFGLSAIRAAVHGMKNMYTLIREPMVLCLRGNTVTVKAVLDVVHANDLPKEYGKAVKPTKMPLLGDGSIGAADSPMAERLSEY